MKIPFFRYQELFERDRSMYEAIFATVGWGGAFILQKDLREFEERLADYVGVPYAIGTGNATDALELVMHAAGIGRGAEVLLPSHTFVASAGAVVAAGATPVFVEIGADHLMDPTDAEAKVTERTAAIMPTQLNGRTADMAAVEAVASRHDLVVLEDSAQGLGSRFRGRMAGSFGVGGVYSFYPAKTLGCFGDGGAVVTSARGVAEEIRQRRDHGRHPETGEIMRWGRNSRLDNLHAAILNAKLATLDEEIERRRELAALYHEALSDVPGLALPPAPDQDADHHDVFQNYEIEAEDRDLLRDWLAQNEVGTILQWGGKGVHQFEALGIDVSLPETERIMARSLLLPMNTSLTDEEVSHVCRLIRQFYDQREAA